MRGRGRRKKQSERMQTESSSPPSFSILYLAHSPIPRTPQISNPAVQSGIVVILNLLNPINRLQPLSAISTTYLYAVTVEYWTRHIVRCGNQLHFPLYAFRKPCTSVVGMDLVSFSLSSWGSTTYTEVAEMTEAMQYRVHDNPGKLGSLVRLKGVISQQLGVRSFFCPSLVLPFLFNTRSLSVDRRPSLYTTFKSVFVSL